MWGEVYATADAVAAWLLVPLAIWILISGADDLLVDAAGLCAWFSRRLDWQPARRDLLKAPQQRIAIFVPCWQESKVIAEMIAGNRERILYSEYDFFVGAYSNDEATLRVLDQLERRFPNVHLALCPHPGPTSKADCLNWIYQRMRLFEEDTSCFFEVVMTHDAEDVIHPDSLHWVNWYAGDYDMVQIPVLPLPTPLSHWTHGVYCDEFAEYQSRDMPARQWMGAFVPSNGVGTGFSRQALDAMAAAEGNRIFEPVCLTEDYENGLRLGLRGARQLFIKAPGNVVATREYFPQTVWTAIRQRTRWVTGISLQTWQRHGWRGNWATRYWLWRDRKGLLGNPASLLANALFVWGLLASGPAFQLRLATWAPLMWGTALVGLYRIGFRCWSVGSHFGWKIAAGVPLRIMLANVINSAATLWAIRNFALARIRRVPLVWVKTEHQYPNPQALRTPSRQSIREVLVRNGYVTQEQLAEALASRAPGVRVGEQLQALGYLKESELYEALSLQSQLPYSEVRASDVRREVARSLPADVAQKWKVVPFRVEDGKLLVASADVPEKGASEELERFTRLEIRFHLVIPSDLKSAMSKLLG